MMKRVYISKKVWVKNKRKRKQECNRNKRREAGMIKARKKRVENYREPHLHYTH